MTRHRDSNPAQYERFGHLLHTLAHAPSVELCLNGFNVVSFLNKDGNDVSWSSKSHKTTINVTLLGIVARYGPSTSPNCRNEIAPHR